MNQPENCPFCDARFRGGATTELATAFSIPDQFPVSPGHTLVIPRRHVSRWRDTTPAEREELLQLLTGVQAQLEEAGLADGFNIGVNEGPAAGQTIPHLHLHVIPRRAGDVVDPRGGVRHVIPDRGNYLSPLNTLSDAAPHRDMLISGGDQDPLLPHLRAHLAHAMRFDLAVAFVLSSGWSLLDDAVRSVAEAGGMVRVLTGDYLGCTEPEALRQLLDLQSGFADRVEVRVFEAASRAFHPKSYLIESDQARIAIVGSSNLSRSALERGVEWNLRLSRTGTQSLDEWQKLRGEFSQLFTSPATQALTEDWISRYEADRAALLPSAASQSGGAAAQDRVAEPVAVRDEPLAAVTPHSFQQEALEALELTRLEGNGCGLVVLATGLGKTYLAAFDSLREEFGRVLFVAHREEILRQAQRSFRRVRPSIRSGWFTGGEKQPAAEVLFASVQALSREENLRLFRSDAFAYIIIDEFHHAAAGSYRRLLDHFTPAFLLGLTATPERMDGGDLLELCGENLVYRAGLKEGIEAGKLCPFSYFGVPDEVDYAQIPWRRGRFDEGALTTAVATQARATNAWEQLRKHGGTRTIAFCVSIRHAQFMEEFFNSKGVRAVSVHSGEGSHDRRDALARLESGEIEVICAVDVFNEGVDLPAIDTVLLLRPTQSRALWLQQVGRGLRLDAERGKERLNIIDYVGNHKTFLHAFSSLFQIDRASSALFECVESLKRGDLPEGLPEGCRVTYELEALDLLEELSRPRGRGRRQQELQRLLDWVKERSEQDGQRPGPLDAFREGFDVRFLLDGEPWHAWCQRNGLLTAAENEDWSDAANRLLAVIQTTDVTRSYKLVVLAAWLRHGGFPAPADLSALTSGVQRLLRYWGTIALDFTVDPKDSEALARLLQKYPIAKWTGPTSGASIYFKELNGGLAFKSPVPQAKVGRVRTWIAELVEWRLAEYLNRPGRKRRYQFLGEDGENIDAVFSMKALEGKIAVTLESRSGKKGAPNARNSQYKEGLRLLLERLRMADVRIEDIEYATSRVSGIPLGLKQQLPVRLRDLPSIPDFVLDIQRAQSHTLKRIQLTFQGERPDWFLGDWVRLVASPSLGQSEN